MDLPSTTMDFTGAFGGGEQFHREVLVLERQLPEDGAWVWCSVFDNMADAMRVAQRYPEWTFRLFGLPINDDVLGGRSVHAMSIFGT